MLVVGAGIIFVEIFAVSVLIVIVIVSGRGRNFNFFAKQEKTYDNLSSRQVLESSFLGSLKLTASRKTVALDEDMLVTFRGEHPWVGKASSYSSLANYFFSQARTSNPWGSYANTYQIRGLAINNQALGNFLLELSKKLQTTPQDAVLEITGGRATNFVPHRVGQSLNLALSQKIAKQALVGGIGEFALPLIIWQPKIKLGDLNSLGINDLLARGQSDFSGSTASRIVNVKVGASQFNGVVVKPGEEFSFNKYLGPITVQKGYLPELVIKPEGTIPELGGGLCQVATTAFRAAFFSGLPITQRRNHSYAVHYYEWIADDKARAVGLDATIYPGAQDMKFVNDTPGAILIWTKTEGKHLYFDFYGTLDSRTVIMDGPHPYDKKPDGSVKSKVTRTVIRNGRAPEVVTFNSRYVSPNSYPKIYQYPKPEDTSASPPPTLPNQ